MCVPLWPGNAVAKIKCSKFQTLYSHRNIISYDLTFFLVPLFRGAVCMRPSLMSPTVYSLYDPHAAHRFLFWFLYVESLARERGRRRWTIFFVYELEFCFWDTKSIGVGVSATDKRLKQQYKTQRRRRRHTRQKCGSQPKWQTSEQKSSPTSVVTHTNATAPTRSQQKQEIKSRKVKNLFLLPRIERMFNLFSKWDTFNDFLAGKQRTTGWRLRQRRRRIVWGNTKRTHTHRISSLSLRVGEQL